MTRGRTLARVALVAGALGALIGGVAISVPAAAAPAAVLKDFDPGDIISDAVMYNPTTMTVAQVQAFLDAEVPSCVAGYTCLKSYTQTTRSIGADPMCHAYQGAANETAATIIVKVATACGVNPQALIVTLQKEEGLVTDSTPSAGQYRIAMGYGCPDTAACDANYYGFFNQVYKAAWAFVRYTMPPGTGPGTPWYSVYGQYPVGKVSYVLYNPNPACGSRSVLIKNKATKALYTYTPYTPNDAALAAGWGIGSSCSAYGNRNFSLYFHAWFGSTDYTIPTAIQAAWTTLGGANGPLGEPIANPTTVSAAGGGTVQRFAHGTVYSSAAGTFAVTGSQLAEYTARGGPAGVLGWPRTAVAAKTVAGGGSVQGFTGGTILTSPKGTFTVSGDIQAAYAATGAQNGAWGWPTAEATAVAATGSGATATAAGTRQAFTGGTVYEKAGASPLLVAGPLLAEYVAHGGPAGALGWPTAAVTASSAAGGGAVQAFANGSVYSSPRGAFAVPADVAAAYTAGPAGALGWPTGEAVSVAASGTAPTATAAGTVQPFAGGTVYAEAGSTPRVVSGPALTEYRRRGGPASTIGWPVSAATTVASHPGGVVQTFERGAVFSDATRTLGVAGDIWTKYKGYRAEAGTLGWPLAGARPTAGGFMEEFTGGDVFWSPTTGAQSVGGAYLREYLADGAAAGVLGFPTAAGIHVTADGRGATQAFSGGTLWGIHGRAYAVTGTILNAYLARQAEAGRLSWPTADAVPVVSSVAAPHSATPSPTTSTPAPTATGTPRPVPTGTPTPAPTGTPTPTPAPTGTPTPTPTPTPSVGFTQTFLHGTITVSAAGVLSVHYR